MTIRDGKGLEGFLGKMNKDIYHKHTVEEVGSIPKEKIVAMSPEQIENIFLSQNHEAIKENIDLCYKLVRESQPWSDPTEPGLFVPSELHAIIDGYLQDYSVPFERLEYYTAVKSDSPNNKKLKSSNLDTSHLDSLGVDAFFELVLSDSDETGRVFVRVPIDLTKRDTYERKKILNANRGVYIMQLDDMFDYEYGKMIMGDMKKKDFSMKHIEPHAREIADLIKFRYKDGNILTEYKSSVNV